MCTLRRINTQIEIRLDQLGLHQQPAAIGVRQHVDARVQQRFADRGQHLLGQFQCARLRFRHQRVLAAELLLDAEFARHRERFAAAVEGMRVGKISGAVGTYTMLTPAVEQAACARLGLAVDPVSTQIIQRDRHAHYFTALALAAGGVERLCVELRHLQRTEVLEVEEGFGKGQKGSSAMPHKKNPISAENMTGLARLVRSNALAAMENMALWHERDISHSSVERVIMPDSTILMDYILHRLTSLVKNLRVLPENMQRNLMASYGLFFSQRVLHSLMEEARMPRQEAYALVQRLAMQSWETRTSFPELVRADAAMQKLLSGEKMDELFNPASFLVYEEQIFSRVFGEQA